MSYYCPVGAFISALNSLNVVRQLKLSGFLGAKLRVETLSQMNSENLVASDVISHFCRTCPQIKIRRSLRSLTDRKQNQTC